MAGVADIASIFNFASTTPSMLVLSLAIILDLLMGEPPSKIHPVVWMGKLAGFMDRIYPRRGRTDVFAGALVLLIVIFFALGITFAVNLLPFSLSLIAEIYLVFSSISIRSMAEHALRCVGQNVEQNKQNRVRREEVAMIVSRDVEKLSEAQLSSAVIESTAENFVDGLFAPIFYYVILGLPGLMLYKAVNICDAMLGYKNEKYRYFGMVSARADDILNFIPARLSALLFILLKPSAWRCITRFRKVKLNGGYPMSGMAALLGVRLEKPGVYAINCGRLPGPADIIRAVRYYYILSALALLFASFLLVSLHLFKGLYT
jgi:adenosylcobinamide-phosphate synthase